MEGTDSRMTSQWAEATMSSLEKGLPGSKELPILPPPDLRSPTEPAPARVTRRSIQSQTSFQSSFEPWTPTEEEGAAAMRPPAGFTIEKPPRPITKDFLRPTTAVTNTYTQRSSVGSFGSRRTIKYGTGKFANIELVPQPSNEPEDPFNWPMWRKHLNFFALVYMVFLVGVMKTIFITVNSAIATNDGVSYTAAVALTAVPLMLSAVTGMASLIIAKVYGKRPVYLVSTVVMVIGVMWGMFVANSYGQNMASRVFQGIGWGAFDTLVLGSIQDTFFEHEMGWRIVIYNTVSFLGTWAAPLLGGVVSSDSQGFTLQFEILACFLAVGVVLIVFGAPETTFDRSPLPADEPLPGEDVNWPYQAFSMEAAKFYLTKMKPWSYRSSEIDISLLLQAPRAVIAPTTLLIWLASFLPYVSFWGLISSLSLLFSVMPFTLSPASVGALLSGPVLMATAPVVGLGMPLFLGRFVPSTHLATLALGSVASFIGILGFGLYIEGCMTMPTTNSAELNTVWTINYIGANLSFPIISLLLGFIALGLAVLEGTVRPVIQRSAKFNSANVAIGLRITTDMHAGVTCLRSFVAGVFILGLPNAVYMWSGLKSAAIGLGVTQILLAAAVGAVWWRWEEHIRRLDGTLMGLLDLSTLKQQTSFFDAT
ncbi:major facilitator superfamily domain-containing protein [Xylariales sp. PMI_506]|nr:major facilitator superfamily domain-containing protein [Xylariales sp. PMI_506]